MSAPPTTDAPRHADPSHHPAPPHAGPRHDSLETPPRSTHHPDETPDRESLPSDLPRVGFGAAVLLVIALALLLAGLFVLGYRPTMARQERATQEATAVANALPVVSIVKPHPPADTTELLLPANLEAFQQTAVYARANGYIRRQAVDIGDVVQADQLLAELDTPDIEAELARARATAQQAEATLEKARLDVTLAESTLSRYDDVARAGAVAEQELDERRTQLNLARAGLNVAKANLEAARAQIQELQVQQDFARITAPFAGVITERNYHPGALVSANSTTVKPLFRLEQIDTLRVFVNLPQSHAANVTAGQETDLRVSNYPGRRFQGQVVRSAGSIDPATRTMRVEIHVTNTDHLLFAGMYGQVRLLLPKSREVWVVPTSALVYNADGLSLALLQDGKVRFQKIVAGRDFGTQIEVVEGLKGDEDVISNPGEHIKDGAEVRAVAAVSASRPRS